LPREQVQGFSVCGRASILTPCCYLVTRRLSCSLISYWIWHFLPSSHCSSWGHFESYRVRPKKQKEERKGKCCFFSRHSCYFLKTSWLRYKKANIQRNDKNMDYLFFTYPASSVSHNCYVIDGYSVQVVNVNRKTISKWTSVRSASPWAWS
jgi:hypothetical protein